MKKHGTRVTVTTYMTPELHDKVLCEAYNSRRLKAPMINILIEEALTARDASRNDGEK